MKIEKKKILKILLVIMICALIALVIFVILNKNNNQKEVDFKVGTISNQVTKRKKYLKESDTIDKDVYQDKIITEIVTSFSYDNSKKIYINENKELYANNKKINTDIKFRTLYDKVIKNQGNKYLFLISVDNGLYRLSLDELEKDDIILTQIVTNSNVLNFVNINYDSDSDSTQNLVFVLLDNGKIYEAFSNLRYDSNVKVLFDNVMVYQDKSMSNVSGYIFKDANGNDYKTKYIFMTKENETDDVILIITEDNRCIFGYVKEELEIIYEKTSKVTDVVYDTTSSSTEGNLKIYFEDKHIDEYKATCSKYFCIKR